MAKKGIISKLKSKIVGRPKPNVPKSGVTVTKSEYGRGGVIKKKKAS